MPLPDDVRRRVRVALDVGGYSSVEKLAEALTERNSGIGLKRLRAIWQTGDARAVELREIAEACETPFWFMEHGFAVDTREAELRDAISDLRADLAKLGLAVAQQAEELRELRDHSPRRGSKGDGGR